MKADIHPTYKEVKISCACGSTFMTRSTMARDEFKADVCKDCHPFYTGKSKMLDTEGRIDQFMRRYGMKKAPDSQE